MLQSLLGSLFLALRTTLALMRSCVRSQELCARTMTMEDACQVKITLQSRAPNVDSNSLTQFWFYCTAHAALCVTHIGFMCIMTENGRVMHGPWNSWGTISWSWNGLECHIYESLWDQLGMSDIIKTNARSCHSSITHRIYIWPFYKIFIITSTTLYSLKGFLCSLTSACFLKQTKMHLLSFEQRCTHVRK